MNAPMPADAVVVGRVAGAFGVNGWIKVQPFSLHGGALLSAKTWWLGSDAPRPAALPSLLSVVAVREQGGGLVARVENVMDRNGAEALRGAMLYVPRASFPKPDADEFYWLDLIGLEVWNRRQEPVGRVIGLIDTGPHCVLRVSPPGVEEPSAAQEILIPFVSQYGCDVDLPARRISVDWELGWNSAE